jgi:EamA domain-containing membrane protein RarD
MIKKAYIMFGFMFMFMSFLNIISKMEWRTWSLGMVVCFGFALLFREIEEIKKVIDK